MIDLDIGSEGSQKRFWMFTVSFLILTGIFQLIMENYLLAVTSFGAGTTFAILGYEKVREEA
jgi:hypothetical protein